MKKLILIGSIATMLLASCTTKTYTMSSLDKVFYTDIDACFDWKVVNKSGDTVNLEDLNPKVGDTVEIIHTDHTTSKYILTAINN